MKLVLKILGVIVALAIIVAGAGLIYLYTALPKVGKAPEISVGNSPERIERGKYLANHVSVCIDCHSTRDFRYYSGPVVSGTEGKGGMLFEEEFGKIYARNISPTALQNWSDGEIYHAIAAGVNRNGDPLAPMMPYTLYAKMDREDLYDIIAYLRTLAPLPDEVPKSELAFPFSLIVRTIPSEPVHQQRPPESDSLAYGKYLSTIAGCHFCHTPAVQGQPVPDMDFAGGFEFPLPNGAIARTANITPEEDTGIGAWDRAYFINRFKEYLPPDGARIAVQEGEENTVMPWTMYAGMKESDLAAIYAYLRTVKPVKNAVEKFVPPPMTSK